MNKKFWQAVATLVGYTVGAGILGIPFVIAQVGFLPGLSILIGLGFASLLVNLMIAEMILRTRFRHQLAGLIKKYIGPFYKHIQASALIIGYYGALTAYIIGQGKVLAAIFNQPASQQLFLSLLFLSFGIIVLFIGLKIIKVIDFWLVLFLILVIGVICLVSLPVIQVENLNSIDWSKLFLPYGVILFAFGGSGAIFSMREILRSQEESLKPAVVAGSLIPLFIYFTFTIAVIGVTGKATTEIATIGLGQIFGERMILFGNLFAFLAMTTSFITVGLALKQVYYYDYKLPDKLSWLVVFIVPLIIFLFVSQDFIKVIGIAGSLAFGLSGGLIVWAFWRAKKTGDQKPAFALPQLKFIGSLLIVMFIVGLIYTFIEIFS